MAIELNSHPIYLGRSPIFSHVNATLQGLSTVRACNATKLLEKEFHAFQDYNTSCWFLFSCSSLWYAIWLDFTCFLYITCVTYSFLAFTSGKYKMSEMKRINFI